MNTKEIFEIENIKLKQKLIPDNNLEIYCYSFYKPETFDKPINQLQDENL